MAKGIQDNISRIGVNPDEPANTNPSADSYFRGAVADSQAKGSVADISRAQMQAENEAAQKAVAEKSGRKVMRGPTGHELSSTVENRSAEHDAEAEGMIAGISEMKPVTKKDPLHGAVKKHNAAVTEARGANYEAVQEGQDVEQQKVDAYKEHLASEFVRLKGETDAAAAVQQVRQERLMQQEDAVKNAKLAQTMAIEKLSSAPPEDAGRFWASQSGFKKFMFAISAGLLGAAGMDPFAHIDAAIQQDIEAQRGGISKLRSEIDARGGDFAAQQNVYGQILETVQDERTADLILQNARWKQAEAEMMSLAAKYGAAAMGPQQEQTLAKMREALAVGELQLAQLAVKHPYSRTTMQHTMNATERGLRTKQFDNKLKRAASTEADSIGIAQKAVENEPPPGAPASLEERKHSLNERKFAVEQKQAIAGTDKDKMVDAAIGTIDEYLTDYADDVPDRMESGPGGRAWLSMDNLGWFRSAEGRREMNKRNIIGQWALTALTGAHVSPKQQEFLEDLVSANQISGDAIREGLTDLREVLRLQRAGSLRAAEDKTVADYTGVSENDAQPMEELRGRTTRRRDTARHGEGGETFGGVEE